MKVDVSFKNNQIDFEISDVSKLKGKGQGGAEVSLEANNFSFWLPENTILKKKPHNDLIAFSVIASLLPWLEDNTLELPFPVTERFAKTARKYLKVKISNTSKKLGQRVKGKVPAIAFSGGYDSTAAALVMPKPSLKVTFIREDHPNIPRRKDNTQETVRKTVANFNDVIMMRSNLEYVAGPYLQFPTWIALAIPCILLADHLDMKGIAFGSITGASLVKNGGKYEDKERPDEQWVELLAACGLEMYKPVAGLTEISTARIVYENGLASKAVSCTIGEYQKPCNSCKKCFRKYFINCAVRAEELDPDVLNKMLSVKSIQDYILTEAPIYFQHIFMYPLLHFGGRIDDSKFKIVKLFKNKLLLENKWNLDWIIRHDSNALNSYIKNAEVRTHVIESIEKLIDPVNSKDHTVLKKWDLYSFYEDNKDSYDLIQSRLVSEIESNKAKLERKKNRTKFIGTIKTLIQKVITKQ